MRRKSTALERRGGEGKGLEGAGDEHVSSECGPTDKSQRNAATEEVGADYDYDSMYVLGCGPGGTWHHFVAGCHVAAGDSILRNV